MDWEKINLLLDIVHKSLNVPGADYVRSAALAELAAIKPAVAAPVLEPMAQLEEPELDLGARRI